MSNPYPPFLTCPLLLPPARLLLTCPYLLPRYPCRLSSRARLARELAKRYRLVMRLEAGHP